MKSTLILLLIAITFSTFSLTAQHSYIPSERTFTTKDGLSSDKIHALYKGSQGFIWIGTENGLDRFDGHDFVHFNKNTYPEMTLDRVQFIAEDEEGYLWLVEKNKPFEHYFTNPTINFYHTQTGEWLNFEERFGDKIQFNTKHLCFIKQLDNGSIFIFMPKEGVSYVYENGHFTTIKVPKNIVRVSDVKLKGNGELILEGSYKKSYKVRRIFQIDKKGQIISDVKTGASISIQSNNENHQFQLNASNYLIGAINLEAYQIFKPNLNTANSSTNKNIDQTVWDKGQQLLWLKNSSHLFVTKRNGDIVYQTANKFDQLEMPILFDGNTTWYSNKQNGLVALTLEPNHFQVYQNTKEGFSNSGRGIYADKKGNIWISTINGSMHKAFDKTRFTSKKKSFFTTYFKDKSNQVWSFDQKGLIKYNLTTGQEELLSFPAQNLIGAYNSWSMCEAANGNLWFFGNFGYYYSYNPTTNDYKELGILQLEDPTFNVYDIQKKDDNAVWLATNQGLYVLDKDGQYVAHYNNKQEGEFYLPTNDIHHMYQGQDGTVWLATGDVGLIQLTVDGRRLTVKNQFTTQNGLSCNMLHSVYEDDYEYLWLSSNEGLMQLDKQTGKVVTYTTENGLLHNEFNRISHFQAENGTLYFGGLEGVISFHPKHFSKVRHEGSQAPLVVTNFQQFSAKNEQFVDLTQELTRSQTIRLRPNDRFFKINLALLNFSDEATFQYRIRGLYDWQTTKDTELNISGLPYGKYTLEIKAFNANQYKSANTLTYDIHVLRPFYLQWWFLILILGGLGTVAFFFIKWRTQQMLVYQETEQLRQLDKIKSQFFANISHELRTPITLILAPLSNFIKKYQLTETQIQELTSIQNNGKILLNLVNEVLDLSKLEAQKLTLNLSPTKIPQFIERVVANFESAAKVKGIEYQFLSFLQKGIVAQFDQAKLEKILNNLLSNALKFTPNEGTIQIMVTQIEKDLVIKIKDSGEGITATDLPNIFERYFQSNDKEKANSGGTGIGLALTKELTELMNGQISVQSELGEGSEFEVKLPLQLAVNNQQYTEKPLTVSSMQLVTEKLIEPTFNKKKDTILLVEDNTSLQQFIQSILAPHYNVIVTNNGVEALEELATRNPQLVLSDVMMPKMDGFTLLEKVKSDDRFCSIPFILLTARADINDKLRGLRIGVDDYMTKPFEVDELLLRIKNLIQNSKNRSIQETEEVQSKEKSILKKKETTEQLKTQTILTKLDRVNSELKTLDLDWLEQVETIAKREIRNSKYSVEDLAYELHMSRSQLYRKLKKITGLTPNRYFRKVKLHQAKTILETEDVYTVTEVAYAIGFENVSHFTKLYQEEFGKRPHDYLSK